VNADAYVEALSRPYFSLPSLRGKVRMEGMYGGSTNIGSLTLSLSRQGRGDLVPSVQDEELKLGLVESLWIPPYI
jgi:hypothetical protein